MPFSGIPFCWTMLICYFLTECETIENEPEQSALNEFTAVTRASPVGHPKFLKLNDTEKDDDNSNIILADSSTSATIKGIRGGNFSEFEESGIVPATTENQQEENKDDEYHSFDEADKSAMTESENLTELNSRITFHSYRKPWSTAKKCVRYSEQYLYRKLEQRGMLNQWFMANTPEEAGRNFAQSYQKSFESGLRYFDATNVPLADALSDEEDTNTPFECNDVCQDIIWKLNEATAKERNYSLLGSPLFDDGRPPNFGAEPKTSTENKCQLGTFIAAGKCIPQGAEEIEEHDRLCASCHGVYVLSKLCFPRFINAVTCHGHSNGCIFDMISAQAHGSCYMRTLTFKVLHNKGSEECQEWYYEYIEVPASCECYLDSKSQFLSATKP